MKNIIFYLFLLITISAKSQITEVYKEVDKRKYSYALFGYEQKKDTLYIYSIFSYTYHIPFLLDIYNRDITQIDDPLTEVERLVFVVKDNNITFLKREVYQTFYKKELVPTNIPYKKWEKKE